MKFVPLLFFALCTGEEVFNSLSLRTERSVRERNYQDKVGEEYQSIKNEYVEKSTDGTLKGTNENGTVDTILFEGDILLTREQAEEIIAGAKTNEGSRMKRQAFRDEKYPKTLWTNGKVYYSFNSSATEAVRRVFRKAAESWSDGTCITFHEDSTAADRIDVYSGNGCVSNFGRIGGVQRLSLGSECESVGTAAHEIGHALGMFHMQSRHDRDDFIKVVLENIKQDNVLSFLKRNNVTNHNYNLTYDYGSIMQYGRTSGTKNGKPTMVPHDAKYSQTLGSDITSFYDKLMINMHYACEDVCNVISLAICDNGGYLDPKNCARCVCPSGYGGTRCRRRPSGCGQTLNATSSFQKLEDTVGGAFVFAPEDDFVMCNYWIQAPFGSKIEVVIDMFDTFMKAMATEGCTNAGVEIKTGNDTRQTGYRFCAKKNVGTSLISTSNIVPVITYSRTGEVVTTLRYRIASADATAGTGTCTCTC